MNSRVSLLQLLGLGLAAAVIVALNLDTVWSQSVDLAHHYALVYRISEAWSLPALDDPSLGEMTFYPPMAHVWAAVIGRFVGSAFLGVQLLSLISLLLIWGAIVFTVRTLPTVVAIVASLALCLLLVLNRAFFKLELHGSELVVNYFFSQLVSQAIVAATIALAIHIERANSGARVKRTLLIVACIYFATSVHLLPALELFGVLVVVIGWDVVSRWRSLSPKKRAAELALSTVVVSASFASIVLNPAFAAMRRISEHNGGIALTHLPGVPSLVVLCLLTFAVSAGLLAIFVRESLRGGESSSAIKYIGAFGVAIAGTCLMQVLALRLGFGSEYAVMKYAFGLSTQLVVAVSVLAGIFGEHLLRTRWNRHASAIRGLNLLFLLAFMICISTAMFHRKLLDASDVVELERRLIAISDLNLVATPAKSSAAVGLAGQSASVDYMFSIAMLKTPRERAISEVLLRQPLHLAEYQYIVTKQGSGPYDQAACRLPPFGGSISVSEATCLKQLLESSNRCSGVKDFSVRGLFDPSSVHGFSGPEEHGRWSDGFQAAFECQVGQKPPRRMIIRAQPFLHAAQSSQRLAVQVKSLRSEFVLRNAEHPASLEIQLPPLQAGEKLAIQFLTPDAKSPRSLGMSSDARLLGVSVHSVEFD
ncbi:DUF7024 domain-containing protein [Variovorax sp. DT-64]|uniref:DUF7024 domain-containing protein n=1 Tax=Variovorax sp. DT-64 TaxID=3396160 RepID=UPI003F1988EA